MVVVELLRRNFFHYLPDSAYSNACVDCKVALSSTIDWFWRNSCLKNLNRVHKNQPCQLLLRSNLGPTFCFTAIWANLNITTNHIYAIKARDMIFRHNFRHVTDASAANAVNMGAAKITLSPIGIVVIGLVVVAFVFYLSTDEVPANFQMVILLEKTQSRWNISFKQDISCRKRRRGCPENPPWWRYWGKLKSLPINGILPEVVQRVKEDKCKWSSVRRGLDQSCLLLYLFSRI